jgi:hypothetical protein
MNEARQAGREEGIEIETERGREEMILNVLKKEM